MKIKPVYLYISALVIIAIIILIPKNEKSILPNSNNLTNQEMPNDDVHKNMANGPSKDDLLDEFVNKMDSLRKNSDNNPSDTAGIKEYAQLLTASHKPNEAIVQFLKIKKLDPKRVDILLPLTFNYFNIGEYKKAREISNEIIKINPNRAEAYYNLGAISAIEGNKDEAKIFWKTIIEKFPDSRAAKIVKEDLKKL